MHAVDFQPRHRTVRYCAEAAGELFLLALAPGGQDSEEASILQAKGTGRMANLAVW